MDAIKVFTEAIKYMKDFLMNQLKQRGADQFTDHEILWVITVPSIWNDDAKQFMREAAYRVIFPVPDFFSVKLSRGILPRLLLLALTVAFMK